VTRKILSVVIILCFVAAGIIAGLIFIGHFLTHTIEIDGQTVRSVGEAELRKALEKRTLKNSYTLRIPGTASTFKLSESPLTSIGLVLVFVFTFGFIGTRVNHYIWRKEHHRARNLGEGKRAKPTENMMETKEEDKGRNDSSENLVVRDSVTEVAPRTFSRIPRLPRLLTLIWGVLSLILIIGIYAIDLHDREHISSSRMQKAFVAVISYSFGTFVVLYLSNLGYLAYVKKGRSVYARKVAVICVIWPIAIGTIFLSFGEEFLYRYGFDEDFSFIGMAFFPAVGFLISATLWGLASRKTENYDEMPKQNNM
jgi:hypothetical protein